MPRVFAWQSPCMEAPHAWRLPSCSNMPRITQPLFPENTCPTINITQRPCPKSTHLTMARNHHACITASNDSSTKNDIHTQKKNGITVSRGMLLYASIIAARTTT